MQELVDTTGGKIQSSVAEYENLLGSTTKLLGDIGYLPPPGAGTQAPPQEPGFLDGLLSGAGELGAAAVNGLASVGNALLNNPAEALGLATGVGLAAVGAAGFAGSAVLDATVVGILGGAPLGAVSAAGVATGLTMAAAAAMSIADHATGVDRVEPVRTQPDALPQEQSEPAADAPAEPPAPTEIAGMTGHGHSQAMERDGHGVNDAAIEDAVKNPVLPPGYVPDERGGKFEYEGKDARVTLNSKGEVITTWPKNRNGWRHP